MQNRAASQTHFRILAAWRHYASRLINKLILKQALKKLCPIFKSVKLLWIFIKYFYVPTDLLCHQCISHFLLSLRVVIMPEKKRKKLPGKQDQNEPTQQQLKLSTADWWYKSLCWCTTIAPTHALSLKLLSPVNPVFRRWWFTWKTCLAVLRSINNNMTISIDALEQSSALLMWMNTGFQKMLNRLVVHGCLKTPAS